METIRGWKLFRQRKDGTIGPLFINARLRIESGRWMEAECTRQRASPCAPTGTRRANP